MWETILACFSALLRAHATGNLMLAVFAHWVDDLFKVCLTWSEAVQALRLLVLVSFLYGFGLASDKTGLSQVSDFTGVTFDSILMTLSVRPEKRTNCLNLLSLLESSASWSKHLLQKLAGHSIASL